MKIFHKILTACLVLASISIQAQDEKQSRINIAAYGGLGYGIVVNDGATNYNLNSNQGEILFNYKLGQKLGIATGIGYNELSGSGFYAEGSFYHERDLLKIPLLVSYELEALDKFKWIGSLGIFGQTIVKEEYQFLSSNQSNAFQGWSFGVQMGASFVYTLDDNFSLGVKFVGQSDLTRLEPNEGQFFNGDQRINNLSSIGLVFLCSL